MKKSFLNKSFFSLLRLLTISVFILIVLTLNNKPANAAEAINCSFYASPLGASTNSGAVSSPWDLQTALTKTNQLTSGTTLCLKGGIYKGNFNSTISGTAAGYVTIRSAPGEWAVVDGYVVGSLDSDVPASTAGKGEPCGISNSSKFGAGFNILVENELMNIYTVVAGVPWCVRGIDGTTPVAHKKGAKVEQYSVTLNINGSYAIFRDFEVTNSQPLRAVNGWSANAKFTRGVGLNIFAPNSKFINLVVHDTAGIGFWSPAVNSELKGNIVYNTGVDDLAPEGRGHDHSIYTQNSLPTKYINNNIVFNSFGFGIHSYTQEGAISNLNFDSNISFNPGSLSVKGDAPAILVGGYKKAVNNTIKNNYTFGGTGSNHGYEAGCESATIDNNYFTDGFGVTTNNCSFSSIKGNTFLNLRDLPHPTGGISSNLLTGNTLLTAKPTVNKVVLLPVETGRAHLVVYNWSNSASQSVDLSSIVTPGKVYEIRDVQNFLGTPIVKSTYNGGLVSLSLPSNTAPVHQPIGNAPKAAVHTSNLFNTFVVCEGSCINGGTVPLITPSQVIPSASFESTNYTSTSQAPVTVKFSTTNGASATLTPTISGCTVNANQANQTCTFTPAATGTWTLNVVSSTGHTASATTTVTVNTLPVSVNGCNYFASPTGTSVGNGSAASPWDLQTALGKTTTITGGKTLCLKGGKYTGRFFSSLAGSAGSLVTVKSAPGEWAIIDSNVSYTLVEAMTATAGADRNTPVACKFSFATNIPQSSNVVVDNEVLRIFNYNNGYTTCYRGQNSSSSATTPIVAHSVGALAESDQAALTVNGSYVDFRNFEVTNSKLPRVTPLSRTQAGAHFANSLMPGSVEIFAPNSKFVNILVQNAGSGLSFWNSATNSELYGNIMYNNGWISPARGHGHNIYSQNNSTDVNSKKIKDNILFGGFSAGVQIYGTSNAGILGGYTIDGNLQMDDHDAIYSDLDGKVHNTKFDNNFAYGKDSFFSVNAGNNVTQSNNYELYWETSNATKKLKINGAQQTVPTTGQSVKCLPSNENGGVWKRVLVYNYDSTKTSYDFNPTCLGLSSGQQYEIYDIQNIKGGANQTFSPFAKFTYSGSNITLPLNLTAKQAVYGYNAGTVIPSTAGDLANLPTLTHTSNDFNGFLIVPSGTFGSTSVQNPPTPINPTASFASSSYSVTLGSPVTVTFSTSNGASASISPAIPNCNVSANQANQTCTFTPAASGTWTLNVVSSTGNTASATTNITASQAQSAPTPPTILPNGGSSTGSVTVSLSTATAGSTIYYTTDDSNPVSSSSRTTYSSSFTLTSSKTVKAVAFKNNLYSSVTSASFTVTPTPVIPTASFASSTYSVNAGSPLTVTFSTSNGSVATITPSITNCTVNANKASQTCSFTPTASGTWILNVVSSTGHTASASTVVTVSPVVVTPAIPVITPNGGTFTGTTSSISLTTNTPGASIFYTLEGNDPTIPVNRFDYSVTGPFTLSSTKTIKVVSYKDGLYSPRASATFTVTAPPVPTGNSAYIEAETGALAANIKTDVPGYSGTGYFTDTAANTRYSQMTFTPSQTGTYYMWGRVYAQDNGSNIFGYQQDSFHVKVADSNNNIISNYDIYDDLEGQSNSYNKWTWTKVNGRACVDSVTSESTCKAALTLNPRGISMTAGKMYYLTFKLRDANSKLDKIFITNKLTDTPSDVIAPPTPVIPSANFAAGSYSVTSGNQVTLAFSTAKGTSATISPSIPNCVVVADKLNQTCIFTPASVTVKTTTTYTLTVTSSTGDKATATTSLSVDPTPIIPVVSFGASTYSFTSGVQSAITFRAANGLSGAITPTIPGCVVNVNTTQTQTCTFTPATVTAPTNVVYKLNVTSSTGHTASATTTVTINPAPTPPTPPTILPNGGSSTGSVTVSLSTATAGSTIYYTTDDSNPVSSSSRTTYSSSFTLTSSKTVKAVAFKNNLYSSVTSASFTVTPTPVIPTASFASSTYSVNAGSPLTVTFSTSNGSVATITPSITNCTVNANKASQTCSFTPTASGTWILNVVSSTGHTASASTVVTVSPVVTSAYIEAESGTTTQYIKNQFTGFTGSGYFTDSVAKGGETIVSFSPTKTGTYYIWGRVYAQDNGSNIFGYQQDSFHVKVTDSSNNIITNYDIYDDLEGQSNSYNKWTWTKVNGRACVDSVTSESTCKGALNLNPRGISMTAGKTYKITFKVRDANSKLDKIFITDNANQTPQ